MARRPSASGFQKDGANAFYPPQRARDVVERVRLLRAVDAALDVPLTLISAPAGFGKTTLLLSWAAARSELAVAWLSADDVEDGPAFWTAATRALAAAAEVDRTWPGNDESPHDAFLRIAEEATVPVVLVVDDFHELRSDAILRPLRRLFARGAGEVRFVLSSRRDPDLSLHRLRLAGHVAEVRARDLAFTLDEAVAFFAAARLELRAELVSALLARTEGWAAALRFAAISLRAHSEAESFVLALTRTEQAVSDYLIAEVLAAQPPRVRDFLLRTSICARIDGPLADDLTGRSDGRKVLAELEHDNVFIELEPEGRRYRYHSLFRQLLQAEAQNTVKGGLGELHRVAARRLALGTERFEALHHALAAGDAALAAELVGMLWIELDGRGDDRAARAVLDCVDADAVARRPQLGLLAAWQAVREGRPDEGDAWLKLADSRAADLSAAEQTAFDLGRAIVELRRFRSRGDLAAFARAVKRFARPKLLTRSRDGDGHCALLLCARGFGSLWAGDLDAALPILEAAVDAGRRAGLQAAEGEAAALLALSCAFRGDLKRASRLARPLVPELGTLREHRPEQAPALVALARCSLDWDDAEEARALAEQARTIAESLGDRLGRVAARIVSAQAIARLSPNSDLAHAELAALAAEGDGPLVPPLLAASVDVLRVRLAEAVGDRAAAAAILIEGTGPEYDVEAARIALSLGELDDACELLGRVLDDGSAPRTTLVDAAVHEALAALRRDASAEAGAWIERAFETAEPDGIRRPFVDGGPQMIRLLRDAIRHGTAHRWLAGSLLAVLEGRQAAGGHMTRELLDPLSDREAIVLGYLPTMLSNQEIAGELFVSVNTVKTHLKSIYRKLGVSSRREAVCLARELRLVG